MIILSPKPWREHVIIEAFQRLMRGYAVYNHHHYIAIADLMAALHVGARGAKELRYYRYVVQDGALIRSENSMRAAIHAQIEVRGLSGGGGDVMKRQSLQNLSYAC